MHSLDDHDGVVDHDGNGQQKGRQRQQVNGEAEDTEEEERTDERHRHSDERDERRAPVLKEDVDDDEHQDEGEDQREHHLLDRGIEELGDVVVDLIVHARREQLGLLLKLGLHLLGNLVGVGACDLLHHAHHRGDVVVLHRDRILQSAKLYRGHILQLQRLAVSIARYDDVAKLLFRLQTAGVAHGVLIGHISTLAEGTWGCLDVLLSQHTGDVGRHEPVLLHDVGLQPDTHRVGLHTRRLHIAHTLDTLDSGYNINIIIVREELVVISAVGGQCEHKHLRGLTLHHRHTNLRDFSRQERLRLRDAVLDIDRAHVRVHALAEKDAQRGRSG